MVDLKAMVMGSRPREDEVSVCLDADLDTTLRRLQEELGQAEQVDKASFSGGHARAVLDEMERVRKRVADQSITLHMRAMDWTTSLRLEAEHPPREGNKLDQAAGHNIDSYYPALVQASCFKVTHVDGTELDAAELDDGWWSKLFTTVNYAQFDKVFGAALTLNRRDSAAPFLPGASQTSRETGADSAPPALGESHPDDSTAGNRASSTRSRSGTRKAGQSGGSARQSRSGRPTK
jgi:hypothetical protein